MPERISVAGGGKAAANLNRLGAALHDAAGAAVRAAGATIGDGMARRAPALSDEYAGSLPRSIRTRRVSDTAVLVGTSHGMARVVEDGGEVTPRRSRLLKFAGGDGGTVYATRVVLPARPFVRPAADEDRSAAGRAAQAAARSRIRRGL